MLQDMIYMLDGLRKRRTADKIIMVREDVRKYLLHLKADLDLRSYNDAIIYLINVEREKLTKDRKKK